MSFCNWTKDEIAVFSKTQMTICEMKAGGSTNLEIMNHFDISEQAIYTAIRQTMFGNKWEPHKSTGGGLSYINDVETRRFLEKIDEYYLDLNCLKL
mgnify:CR=1 FL=1